MNRRELWRPILEAEVRRWNEKSCDELIADLADEQCYEVEFGEKKFQVEVQILENTDRYMHVAISVDDGSIAGSFKPLATSFIRQKTDR